jgi:hypothetical protein
MYNGIWSENSVRAAWTEATIISVLKPVTYLSLQSSQGPIREIRCVCKTVESMENGLLVWILESRSLLSDAQRRF